MTLKQKMLHAIDGLPEETSIDEAIETLYLLKKIEIGVRQLEAGEGVPQEEVERQFLAGSN